MKNELPKKEKKTELAKAIEEAEKQDEDTYSFIYLNIATEKVHTDKIIIAKPENISLLQNFMKNKKMCLVLE